MESGETERVEIVVAQGLDRGPGGVTGSGLVSSTY